MTPYIFWSERLGFRTWENKDLAPFAALNSDERVMEFFPNPLSPKQSEEGLVRIRQHFEEHGFGFYAVDRLDTRQFIGFIGFAVPNFHSFFTPCVEIGWRLGFEHWGQGLATEGAQTCLTYGFQTLEFREVFSFTALQNKRSERVMIKIGMEKMGTFDHPKLEAGHWLRKHVLYKKTMLWPPPGKS